MQQWKHVLKLLELDIDSSLHDTPSSPFFVEETPPPSATQSKLANKFSFSEKDASMDSSSQRSEEQETLHQRFVAKFGETPENRSVKKFKANDFTAKDITHPTKAQPLKHKTKTNYTPLELQVVELKEKHPDVLLVVEVGYKYKFFGEDAKV